MCNASNSHMLKQFPERAITSMRRWARFDLTRSRGCDAAELLWADPRQWPVHTGDPRNRPRPPQTTQTGIIRCRRATTSIFSSSCSNFWSSPAAFCQTSGYRCWKRSRPRVESELPYGWHTCQPNTAQGRRPQIWNFCFFAKCSWNVLHSLLDSRSCSTTVSLKTK